MHPESRAVKPSERRKSLRMWLFDGGPVLDCMYSGFLSLTVTMILIMTATGKAATTNTIRDYFDADGFQELSHFQARGTVDCDM